MYESIYNNNKQNGVIYYINSSAHVSMCVCGGVANKIARVCVYVYVYYYYYYLIIIINYCYY